MKEKTKQILKVSICTLMALVLFAGVILMCIYFAFDNSNDGVAKAYTDEEVGVSNLQFDVDDGFYIKNFNEVSLRDIKRIINYYTYFIPGVMSFDVDFDYYFNVCTLSVNYTNMSGFFESKSIPIYLRITQHNSSVYDFHYLTISALISDIDDLYFFEMTYDFANDILDEFLVSVYGSQSVDSPYNYYINFENHPDIEGNFAHQLASAIFDDIYDIYSIDLLSFDFVNYANLGIFFSSNQEFANPPVVIPEGVYDETLQDKYDEGYAEGNEDSESNLALIEELREELRYYESLDLNMSLMDVFNPARMKSSTFVYDGVTYTSNSIVSTDDGWDVYSSTYHNEELPPNYGVGFSLFLPESISNTKFYVYGDITGWYNYTYCSEPDEQGNQQCYQVTEQNTNISVGYRNQNGNIVKVGTFTSNLPGAGGVDFFIDSPTNEIVFFVENCNLMEVDINTQVIYYYFDTESIYNDGYETGKSQGIKIGREEGYYEGVADANDYSFFSLFTSVFDAPITAIVGKWGDSDGDGVYQREGGMLNFYIPGLDINFAPFLLSLFTIAIIILVIRFVMARKS